MSTVDESTTEAPERRRDLSQLGLVAVLLVVAVVLVVDAAGLRRDFADTDPVGPSLFPYVVATGLVVTAILLAVATLRGSVPELEGGEDVDLQGGADWRTVGLLVLVFIGLIATVDLLGWTIASALFFTATARVLGSRTWVRDLLIGVALGLISFYGFYSGLGVPLPAGVLDGVL